MTWATCSADGDAALCSISPISIPGLARWRLSQAFAALQLAVYFPTGSFRGVQVSSPLRKRESLGLSQRPAPENQGLHLVFWLQLTLFPCMDGQMSFGGPRQTPASPSKVPLRDAFDLEFNLWKRLEYNLWVT